MLTQQYRPKRFAEMRGAEHARKILKRIVLSPSSAPRSLIFMGGRGTGKTTSIRIFVKALNCENNADGDCCNKCSNCLSITDNSPLYQELDSAIVGNVEEMKNLRGMFAYGVQKGIRVIGFDECHTVSKAAQSTLLKVLEEAPPTVFFIFLTTDPERILPTIKSRSLEVEFGPLTEVEISKLLKDVASKEGVELDSETSHHICRRVKGHARDALQQLEMVKLLGAQEYRESAQILDEEFEKLIVLYENGDLDGGKKLVEGILTHPVLNIEQDFDIFIRKMANEVFIEKTKGKNSREVVVFYLKNHQYLRSSQDWYLFLIAMAQKFEKVEAPSTSMAARFSKGGVPIKV